MCAARAAEQFRQRQGTAAQTKAAVARSDGEEEIRRLHADTSLSYDDRAEMVEQLRAGATITAFPTPMVATWR
ncbi:hypothetical protein XH88_16860 [Bradyrhizobium sp. CCBAU 51627]|nr:hypothetical protein [Bradyrhizobium sp. CCBAU 51627]